MKKLVRKIDYNYLYITLLCIFLVFITMHVGGFFASNTDWINQHLEFANYFRNLFYKTGNLFPNFALNIGSGQNIYNFSYYGLYSPYLLFSYLFPGIKMVYYLQIINVITYVLTGCLFYKFLKGHFNKNISLLTTIILIMSGSLLFQFHRQFMFVNYMPFLIISLIGVDRYFKNESKHLIIIGTFLMIMTSYYYSITGIIVIIIYTIYKYFTIYDRLNQKIVFKIIKDFFMIFIISIMLASVLLLPTLYTLLNGRGENSRYINILTLFIPSANINGILYDKYALGLTSISLYALIYNALVGQKSTKILSRIILVILIFPIFVYIFNGTLYVRNKILIPFLPLMGIVIGKFIIELLDQKLDMEIVFLSTLIMIISILFFNYIPYETDALLYLDMILIASSIYLYRYNFISKAIMILFILVMPLGVVIFTNLDENYVLKKDYESYERIDAKSSIRKTLKKENDIVRFSDLSDDLKGINRVYGNNYYTSSVYSSIENSNYVNLYKNVLKNSFNHRNKLMLSNTNNIFYQTLMGHKYVYNNYASIGYKEVKKDLYNSVYINKNVLPIFYGSSNIINYDEYEKIKYPHNLDVLINNVVANSKTTSNYKSTIKEEKLKYKVVEKTNLSINKKKNYIEVIPKYNNYLKLELEKPLKNEVLIISFDLNSKTSCEEGDQKIYINGITNLLTCDEWIYKNQNTNFNYVLSSSRTTKNLKITFNPDIVYKIANIRVYRMNYDSIKNVNDTIYKFKLDNKKSTDNKFVGTINMEKNGYFVTSIPYDAGFKIYVDGKKVEVERVNTSFVGFKLSKGFHNIKVIFEAPFLCTGKVISVIGLLLFGIVIYNDMKKKTSN